MKKVLDKLALTEEQIEGFLEQLEVHCFKNEEDNIEEFMSQIVNICTIANNLDIPIYDLVEYIEKKVLERDQLDLQIYRSNQELEQEILQQKITRKDLEEYRENQPLLDRIKNLKHTVENLNMILDMEKGKLFKCEIDLLTEKELRYVSESEFDDANKEFIRMAILF